jgi:MFS family permease
MGSKGVGATALRLVLLLGFVSLFADFTYEGARSVAGPFLLGLGASAFTVGAVTGLGEFASYALRPISGRLTDRIRRPWLIAIPGYVVNLLVVPALALAGSWPVAAVLFILERVGKGIRNPPRDTILSHAGAHVGAGWAFGLHEGLDQAGAVVGPLAIALVLVTGGSYRTGFAILLLPAIVSLVILGIGRATVPTPGLLEPESGPAESAKHDGLGLLLLGAGLLGASMIGFPIVAYFFAVQGTVSAPFIPVLYAVGMAAEGLSALALGRAYGRLGPRTILLATLVSVGAAPLLFEPRAGLEFVGMALWGIGMGAQTSVLSAIVATRTSKDRRATAFGELQSVLGIAGLAGGFTMGGLLGVNPLDVVLAAVALGLSASFVLTLSTRSRGHSAAPR